MFPKLVLRVSSLSKRDMDYEWFSLGLQYKIRFELRISRQKQIQFKVFPDTIVFIKI